MTKYKINPGKTEQNEVLQDEKLEQNTFYCSDIEFEERNFQKPLLWGQMVLFKLLQMKNAGYSTKMLKEILEKATAESRKKLSTIALNRAVKKRQDFFYLSIRIPLFI